MLIGVIRLEYTDLLEQKIVVALENIFEILLFPDVDPK